MRTIKLSSNELQYLLNAGFLEPHQLDALRTAEWFEKDSALIRISDQLAEQFRDALTFQLAKVGFDDNYNLTQDGRMLEDLIDRFVTSQD